MEIKEVVFENLISKTENITKTVGDLLNAQQTQLAQMHAAVQAKQNSLTAELLALSSDLSKNNLGEYATRIESYVVQHLLKAPYDAKQAFATHKALFAERHEMAVFLSDNLSEIKQRVNLRVQNTAPVPPEKIKVFTYWDNDDKLPPIVAMCRESLKKHIPEDKFDLIILNSESYKEWTDFRKGEIKADISQAHFTDILRMKLLDQWGGFWLDATDMLTQNFYQATQNIRQQKQFLFCYINSRVGNWFIFSNPNNYILAMAYEMLILWWNTKGYLTNYFMTHDVIEMLYWVDTDYRNEWDKMLKTHPRNALAVLRAYSQTTTPEAFQELLQESFVHKLTYKYDSNKVKENSVLSYLLKHQI